MITTRQKSINKMVLTSILISAAVVINFFKIDIPLIAGAPMLRISFASPFLAAIAIMCGPGYGAIAGGLIDIIGYILQPTGAYIPFLTITSILKGLLFGLFFLTITNLKTNILPKLYICFFSIVGLIGLVNTIIFKVFPLSPFSQFINSIGLKYAYATIGFILVFVISIFQYYFLKALSTKFNTVFNKYLQLIIVVGLCSIIITTLNTYILKLFMPALSDRAFIIIWIPRVVETLLMLPLETYVLMSIIKIYKKIN